MQNAVNAFVDALKTWAVQQSDILAAAIVGSHARGDALPDSDIDIILIVDDSSPYLKTSKWLERFGEVRSTFHEDWGLLQSRRVHYVDGTEVEFGITIRRWASIDPIDRGTERVVSNGMHILYDREMLLQSLLAELKRKSIHS